MTRAWPFPLHRLKRIFLVYLGFWLIALLVWWNNPYSLLEKNRYPGLPFGFVRSPEGSVQVQDFAYNLVFFRGIHERIVAHPYRLADQEKMVRTLLPTMTAGLSHAYSPVAYVLAWPLLQVSGEQANFLYEFICTVGIILLLRSYLLPRMESYVQIYGFALCAGSICLALAYALGQSSLLTTTVLAAFWVLLQRTPTAPPSLARDAGLALLFWILCLKPSVAIIPFALLLGVGAGRALLMGFGLLGLTWLVLAPLYGGWWSGLQDYAYLLNHYNNSDFTPFMRRDYRPGYDFETRALFTFDRWMTLGIAAVLIALRWRQRITLSEMFQALVGSFLLFFSLPFAERRLDFVSSPGRGSILSRSLPARGLRQITDFIRHHGPSGRDDYPVGNPLPAQMRPLCLDVSRGYPRAPSRHADGRNSGLIPKDSSASTSRLSWAPCRETRRSC